jgi:CheY-like chemotaxis protein
VFTAYFPIVEGSVEKIVQSRIVDAVLARGNVPVLVVDDNTVNLTVAQGYLNTHNIFPDTAKSGGEAIDMVQAKDYDLVFMDHMMPVMDGIETTQRIRNLPDGKFKALPIIALTANAVAGVKEMMLAAGMNDFISKPIEASELNEVLLAWLPHDKIEIRRKESPSVLPIAQSTGSGAKPFKRTQQALIWQASIQRQSPQPAAPSEPQPANIPEGGDDALLEKLKTVEGVDVKSGLLHLGGRPPSYFRTIRRFCEEFINYRATLERTSAAGEWNDYTVQIHAVKSAGAALGFNDLSAWAASLEKASRGGQTDVCLKETPEFCAAGQKLRDTLAALLGDV